MDATNAVHFANAKSSVGQFFCDYQQVQLSENPTRIVSVALRDTGLHLVAFEDTSPLLELVLVASRKLTGLGAVTMVTYFTLKYPVLH